MGEGEKEETKEKKNRKGERQKKSFYSALLSHAVCALELGGGPAWKLLAGVNEAVEHRTQLAADWKP